MCTIQRAFQLGGGFLQLLVFRSAYQITKWIRLAGRLEGLKDRVDAHCDYQTKCDTIFASRLGFFIGD